MKDSIVIDMKYADYDMIDGSYGVERHHLMGGRTGVMQTRMACGFLYRRTTTIQAE